jgi:hypothetical protein
LDAGFQTASGINRRHKNTDSQPSLLAKSANKSGLTTLMLWQN